MINREPIAVALLNLVSATAGAVTVSRELRHFNEVQPEEMPYLCLVGGNQVVDQTTRSGPPKYLLRFDVYLYVNRKDSADPAQTLLNNMLDALEASLQPEQCFPEQTLGIGTVRHCRVNGTISTDEGTLGDVAVAVVPIEVLAVG